MKDGRSRWAMGFVIVVVGCLVTASYVSWREHQPEVRWQQVAAPAPWPVSRARFDWTVTFGERTVRGMGAILVDREGEVQVDLLDPTYVPWVRWVVTSRHVAVYLLAKQSHFVGYRSAEVLSETLGDDVSVTAWWQQIVTGRAASMAEPTEVRLNPQTGGLDVVWTDPDLSAMVDSNHRITEWRLHGTGTGTVVSMEPSEHDAVGRPSAVIFDQERPRLRLSLNFLEWHNADADASVQDPLARRAGFEERPMEDLPIALFRELLEMW